MLVDQKLAFAHGGHSVYVCVASLCPLSKDLSSYQILPHSLWHQAWCGPYTPLKILRGYLHALRMEDRIQNGIMELFCLLWLVQFRTGDNFLTILFYSHFPEDCLLQMLSMRSDSWNLVALLPLHNRTWRLWFCFNSIYIFTDLHRHWQHCPWVQNLSWSGNIYLKDHSIIVLGCSVIYLNTFFGSTAPLPTA